MDCPGFLLCCFDPQYCHGQGIIQTSQYRMYTNGKAGEDSLMSQDPALPMQKIASALKSYVGQLSESHLQPEFRNLQVTNFFVPPVLHLARAIFMNFHPCGLFSQEKKRTNGQAYLIFRSSIIQEQVHNISCLKA